MKKVLREFRIIPTLLIAVACLAVLKIAGLVLEGGYILRGEATKPSWAQATLNFPGAPKPPADLDITGSVESKPKEAPPPPPETRPPEEGTVYPDPNKTISASERAVLERLQSRRQELETRVREIDIRESLMKSAEKRIENRIEEMKATEARIGVATQQKTDADASRFKGIVTMYEGMKPKDAARVFDRLEMSVLIEIASQIPPRKMSDILGQMQPEVAERLTVELARRAAGDKMTSSAELPKIEGRSPAAARN